MILREWLKKNLAYNTAELMNITAYQNLQKCTDIIDIGCGNGNFIQLDRVRISGIDNNPEAVRWCQQQGYNVISGDALDLPFEDESYDGVYCSHLIEHLFPEEAWELLNQLNRILKPGGILCLSAPLMSRHFYNDLTHIRPYPPQSILEYLGGNWQTNNPQTFSVIKGEYELLKIKWRYLPLLSGKVQNPLLIRILEVLARFGIKSLTRSGYLMILKKKLQD